MSAPLAIATLAVKLDLGPARAQVEALLAALSEVTETDVLTDPETLDVAHDITADDLTVEDGDGDSVIVSRGFEPSVAANVTVRLRGGDELTAYILDDSLDDVITYLQAIQTLRSHA